MRANTETKIKPDEMCQDIPKPFIGLELEKAKKELAETPERLTALRKLGQLRVQNLESQIRAQNPQGLGILPQPPRRGQSGDVSAEADRGVGTPIVAMPHAGFTAHLGVVPVTDEMKRGLDRIHEGFARANKQLVDIEKRYLQAEIPGFEAKYTKAYIEREILPQAAEIAKRALEAGYKVIIATQTNERLTHRTLEGNWISYQELCDEAGDQLSRIVPPLADVYGTLRSAFGENIEDYSGRADTLSQRRAVREKFLVGELPMLYTTYAIGGGALSLCDADYPECGIEGGDKPRVSIFLGAPLSGPQLKHAVGLTWRSRVKSDVHAVFLSTDSEIEVRLMQQGIGPLLRVLGAIVLGERQTLASTLAAYTDEQRIRALKDALAYAEGDGIRLNANNFQVRSKARTVGIDDWSHIRLPLAGMAMYKAMIFGSEITDAYLSTRYHSEFGVQEPASNSVSVDPPNPVSLPSTEEPSVERANSLQPLDATQADAPTPDVGASNQKIREDLKATEYKAMFFGVAAVWLLIVLLTHNGTTGWFLGPSKWLVRDYLSFTSVLGLVASVFWALKVLYPNRQESDPIRALALKEVFLRRGFWIGIVSAFFALAFLVLPKRSPRHWF